MKIRETDLPGVLLVEPRVFEDSRGWFFESWQCERYADAGLPHTFVQDNHSRSIRGTLRGLHYQLRAPQGKLVRVTRGTVFDVVVDIRRGSPTFSRWVATTLSEENRLQVWVPPGFAHGFCALDEVNDVEYKVTAYYRPTDQHGIRWNDPGLAVPWPVRRPVLLARDEAFDILRPDRADLPEYGG